MTSNIPGRPDLRRNDLLRGLRVGISGSVPEEQYWRQEGQNEQILAFVALLSDLVMKYGGRVVHGNHPTFTPLIMGRAIKQFGPRPGGKPAAAHPYPPPVCIVASRLWPLEWEFPLDRGIVEVIETHRVGEGDDRDEETRNRSLTALRLAMMDHVDIVVAVGGKLHRGSGFNPGVLEELTIARWKRLPCIVVAGYGGMAGELDMDVIHQFCSENGLEDEQKARLAKTDQEIDLCVGSIVAHLATLVQENRAEASPPAKRTATAAAAPAEPRTIPTALGGTTRIGSTRLAEVPGLLLRASSDKFSEVRRALEATDIDAVRKLLDAPPISTGRPDLKDRHS